MAPIEVTPASTSTEGNYRIKFVTTIAGAAATVAEFNDGTDITYSLTPDGWNPSQDQAVITDDRLTLEQILERPGKKTKSLMVKYVDSATGAATVLIEGTAGFILVRPIVPNETVGVAAQEYVRWPVTCGEQMDDAPTTNGVFTKSQKLFVTGAVTREALIA